MNVEKILNQLKEMGIPVSTHINLSDINLTDCDEETINKDIGQYLSSCLPLKTYIASGVRVKTAEGIREENCNGTSPGGFLFQNGLIVIASSIGGNVICVDLKTGVPYWADHSSFSEDWISFEDKNSGDWVDLPFTPENIPKALVKLDENFESFIEKLLTNQLENTLDELD